MLDDDELQFGEDVQGEKTKTGSASEQVTVRLDFPGNDYVREPRAIGKSKLIFFRSEGPGEAHATLIINGQSRLL